MTPDQVFADWDGKGVNVDGDYGNQCTDWALQFAHDIGLPIPFGYNAIDYAGLSIPGYTWVPNSATAVPTKGCLVVWGRAVGQYGHIAVANGDGDTNRFKSYDQNWPLQVDRDGNGYGVVHLEQHNYNGVLGWQRPVSVPQGADMSQVTVDQSQIDAWLHGPDGIDHWKNDSYAKGLQIEALNERAASLEAQVNDLSNLHDQLVTAQKQNTDLLAANKDLQDKLDASKDKKDLGAFSFTELLSAIIAKLTGGK